MPNVALRQFANGLEKICRLAIVPQREVDKAQRHVRANRGPLLVENDRALEPAPRIWQGVYGAPEKAEGEASERLNSKPVSPAQTLYAKKIAQGKGVVIPDEAKANSAAMSQWIDSNRNAKRRKRDGKTAYSLAGAVAAQSTATRKKKSRKRPSAPAQPNSISGTPLRISYGNKELALKLGARYRPGGWYAPPGADLSAFGERGWL